MEPITWLLTQIDPVLIHPYRWFENPMLGWWVGTFILALWASLLGELTLAVAYRLNRKYIAKRIDVDIRSLRKKGLHLVFEQGNSEAGSVGQLVVRGNDKHQPETDGDSLENKWIQLQFGVLRNPRTGPRPARRSSVRSGKSARRRHACRLPRHRR